MVDRGKSELIEHKLHKPLVQYVGRAKAPESSGSKVDNQQQKLQKIFYQSFMHSQGESELQEKLFNYLVARGHIPTHLPDNPPQPILTMHTPKQHEAVTQSNYQKTVREEWDKLRKVNHVHKPISQSFLTEILMDMMNRDTQHITMHRPRQGSTVPDSKEDRFSSFIRRYVVSNNSTGNDAFDALYAEMRPILQKLKDRKDTTLMELASLWERKHPGHTFFPKPTTPLAK